MAIVSLSYVNQPKHETGNAKVKGGYGNHVFKIFLQGNKKQSSILRT